MGHFQGGRGPVLFRLSPGPPRRASRRRVKTNLFDLTGKVVMTTGANSGIGLGFLTGCARQGADVVVWGHRGDRNVEALEALTAAGAGRVHHEQEDVADEAPVNC